MAIRNLRYEDDEILKKKSREVEVIDDKIRELAEDMMETMHKWDGLGLAAPQVGVLKRVIVIDLYEEGTQFMLINPVKIKKKGVQEVDEGCLSFPNKLALDINGQKVKIKAKDLLAQALSHEIDHLNGILFTEKVKPGTLEIVDPEEIKRQKEEAAKQESNKKDTNKK